MKENLRIIAAQYTATSNKCCVILNTVGNPDKQQDSRFSLPGVLTQLITVETYKEASDAVQAYIKEHDLGAGNFSGGQIVSPEGKVVAYVSYNGRVWKGNDENNSDLKNLIRNVDDNILADLSKKKVAKLVYVSFLTRVIVDEDASQTQILEASKPKFIQKIQDEISENLEDIVDDTESPYDPEFDDK